MKMNSLINVLILQEKAKKIPREMPERSEKEVIQINEIQILKILKIKVGKLKKRITRSGVANTILMKVITKKEVVGVKLKNFNHKEGVFMKRLFIVRDKKVEKIRKGKNINGGIEFKRLINDAYLTFN